MRIVHTATVESSRPPTLGALLLQRGLISEEALETALAEHLATGRRLGEILVEHGHLDAAGLEGLLAEQQATRAGEQGSAPVQRPGARGIDLLREQLAAAEAELTRQLPASGADAGEGADGEPVRDEPPAVQPSAATPPAPGSVPAGDGNGVFVLFVPTPSGYQLIERSGPLPAVGEEVGVSGGQLVVAKLGASPLPGDPRRCAYLEAPVY